MVMCTWCGHDPHAAGCPRRVLVAASSTGGALARRWTDKLTMIACPCARGAAC